MHFAVIEKLVAGCSYCDIRNCKSISDRPGCCAGAGHLLCVGNSNWLSVLCGSAGSGKQHRLEGHSNLAVASQHGVCCTCGVVDGAEEHQVHQRMCRLVEQLLQACMACVQEVLCHQEGWICIEQKKG